MKTKLLTAVILLLAAVFCIPLLWHDDPVATAVVAAVVPKPSAQPAASSVEQPSTPAPQPSREAVPAPTPTASPTEAPFDPSPVRVPTWLARFLVVDEDDKPVADATIAVWPAKLTTSDPRIEPAPGKGNRYSGRESTALLELHTDPEGRASTMLEREAVVAAAAKASARTGETSLGHTRSNTTETKLVLEMPALLRGIVVRADGSPAVGASVTVRLGGGTVPRVRPWQSPPMVVGADGRFAFPVMRRNDYVLDADLNGARAFRERRHVLDDHPPEVVLAFPGAITLNGIVVDPDGKPIDKAAVSIWREFDPAEAEEPLDRHEIARADSGADGQFSVAVRKHARYQILAAANGHATSDLLWTEPTAARPHAEVRLTLQRFQTIGGAVQHADGSPLAGVTVLAEPEGPDPLSRALPALHDRYQHVQPAVSRADGRFELKVHPGASWSVIAQPVADNPRLSFVTNGVAPGRNDVVVVVSDEGLAGCVVKGSVVLAADGQPCHDFRVGIVSYDEQGKPFSRAVSTKVDIDGNRFELAPLPLGRTIAIQVTPKESGKPSKEDGPHAPARLGPFVTSSAGIDLQVRIDAWGELPVQVLGADGKPTHHIRVSATRDVLLADSPSARPVDAEGKIVLKHCAPGGHKLNIWNGPELLLEPSVTILPGLNPEFVVRLPPASASGKGR